MRSLEPNDQTGELSWPLVERRQRSGATPDGGDRRVQQSSAMVARIRRIISRNFRGHRDGIDQRSSEQIRNLIAANNLLVSLQKIALSLPAALDLEQVLDQSSQQILGLIRCDVLTIALCNTDGTIFTPVRGPGSGQRIPLARDDLPHGVLQALTQNHSISFRFDQGTEGFASDAKLGAYCALRSRRHLIGVVAVEWRDDRSIDQEVQILTALADSMGVAIDNASLFSTLRLSGANDERRRIARELHDRMGSSLAYVGFEIDRLIRSTNTEQLSGELESLRTSVTQILDEVREMLFDLRCGDDGRYSLRESMIEFLDRVQRRSPIATSYTFGDFPELDSFHTNELWEITKEAILNAERHSQAQEIHVSAAMSNHFFEIRIQDDGCGFNHTNGRLDSYGLQGMSERCDVIGADLKITMFDHERGIGTLVCVEFPISHQSSNKE